MIEILLATYNGEKYLHEQLKSLKKQSYTNWKIIARDDGSTDRTVAILKEFQNNNPNKIEIHLDGKKKCGPSQNFNILMGLSKAKYVAFCDQDDVWEPTKLEKSLKYLIKLEKFYGNLPILVHTDLFIVDKNLNIQFKSMIKVQRLNSAANKSIKHLIVQNCVTGCSMMANRELLKVCGSVPKEAVMHDWWLALVASAFGRLQFIDESLVKYRQHESNTLGVTPLSLSENEQPKKKSFNFLDMLGLSWFKFLKIYKIFSLFFWLHFSRNFFRLSFKLIKDKAVYHKNQIETFYQSEAFMKTYFNRLSGNQLDILKKYGKLFKGNKFKRVIALIFSGYFKKGFVRKLIQIFYI